MQTTQCAEVKCPLPVHLRHGEEGLQRSGPGVEEKYEAEGTLKLAVVQEKESISAVLSRMRTRYLRSNRQNVLLPHCRVG